MQFATMLAILAPLMLIPQGGSAFMTTQARRTASSLRMIHAPPKKLLVVGGGIGGISTAYDALHNLRPGVDEITVVSDRADFQFTPSNPWVATRKRTPEDISVPLAEVLPKHDINFMLGSAKKLDPVKRRIVLDGGDTLEYDFLVVATGPRLAFDEIPGAKDWSKCVCTTPSASATADAVDELEKNPGPVVIGAAQGASCFGPAYEFALALSYEMRKRGGDELAKRCKMTFVTPEPHIGHLGLMGTGESQKILEQLLEKKEIEFITNCRVEKVSSDHVLVQDASSKEMTRVPSTFTMLIPPFRGHEVWKRVKGLTNEYGLILVDEYQQSVQYPNIFGVGSCIAMSPVEDTLVPTGAPKTGYMIESMGTAAVKNIRAIIDEEEKALRSGATAAATSRQPPRAVHRHKPLLNGLCITDFGDDGAIFLTLPQVPPRKLDVTVHSRAVILAKEAFEQYFLHKIRHGDTDPYYEKYLLHLAGIDRVTSIMEKPKEEIFPPGLR